MKNKYLFWLLLGIGMVQTSCEPHGNNVANTEYARLFNGICDTMENHYVFFDQMNSDWDSIRPYYQAKINNISEEKEFVSQMNSFLATIGDPYINISYNRQYMANDFPIAKDCSYAPDPKRDETAECIKSHSNGATHSYYTLMKKEEVVTDSIFYDFMAIKVASTSQAAPVLVQQLKEISENSTADGLIIDLRSSIKSYRDINILVAAHITQSLLHKDEEHILCEYKRSESDTITSIFPVTQVKLIGLGYCVDKPIVVLVNENVLGVKHILASMLSELPNVCIIGRHSTTGYGCVAKEYSVGSKHHKNYANNKMLLPSYRYTYNEVDISENILNPDILVDWDVEQESSTSAIYSFDKCLYEAMKYIDSVRAK